MKKQFRLLPIALLLCTAFFAQAQTAEDIVAKYLKQTGGDNWAKLKTIKMSAKVKM